MVKFIDIALVQHDDFDTYTYEAPAFSGLKVGDEVITDGEFKYNTGKVKAVCTINPNSDEFGYILALEGTEKLRRIMAKVEYTDFVYPEESNESDND